MSLTLMQLVAVYALPVVFAITFHEAAHGYVARHFGDMTAYLQGRVSLNPIRHIDPFGTIALPLLLLAVTKLLAGPGIVFGWAKPVPVNAANLRHPRRDMLWVAGAGPFSNLLMALFWAAVARAGLAAGDSYFALPLALMGGAGVFINAIIMVLNLLPLPPLDGGRMLVSLLPDRIGRQFERLEPYGLVILIVLLFTGMLGMVLWPMIGLVMALVGGLFGLSAIDLLRLANVI
jgi:Zn-dependent protease